MLKRLLIAFALLLVVVPAASAHQRYYVGVLKAPAASLPHPFIETIGNLEGSQCDTQDNVVRIILPEWYPANEYLSCAQAAAETGHRLILVVQYGNCWSIAQDKARLRQVLHTYPHAWAMSLGNEQELSFQGGLSCTPHKSETPRRYAQVWRALEPILHRRSPSTLRIAGEVSPWAGPTYLKAAAHYGLPGAQVFDYHPYPHASTARKRIKFVKLARTYHVQAWADEGLCGKDAWPNLGCVAGSTLEREGYVLAGEWYLAPGTASVGAGS